jgi:hypothetical protein
VIYDVHVHLAGTDTKQHGNFVGPGVRQRWLFRLFAFRLGLFPRFTREHPDESICRRTLAWLEDSRLDRAVLLALDGVYARDGTPDPARTQLVTGNDFVADTARRSRKALFGASIHPYRRDAVAELERVVSRGACLLKWIPAAQGIRVDDPICRPFYRRLAELRLPLLCHTGHEHALRSLDPSLGDPAALRVPLNEGVTVIAAHCGSPINRREPGFFDAWRVLALEYGHCYGDLGAFAVPARTRLLRRIVDRDPRLVEKLVYGSDFPALPLASSYLFQVNPRVALRLWKTPNPFDQPLEIMKALGLPDAVFSRAGTLLRLLDPHPPSQPEEPTCRT